MFPSPTAEPTAARMKPARVAQESRGVEPGVAVIGICPPEGVRGCRYRVPGGLSRDPGADGVYSRCNP